MLHLYFKIAFPTALLLTAVLLLIHAQPYDDHDLRTMLIDQNCEMPCFMGIRPGVTTVDEAVKRLEASAWVEKVVQQGATVQWFWNAQAPAFLDGIGSPSLSGLKLDDAHNRVVSSIHIPTRLSAGFIYLLRQPVSYHIIPSIRLTDITSARFVSFSVWFEAFAINTAIGCSKRLDDLWRLPVDLSIESSDAIYRYWSQWDSQRIQKVIDRHWGC